MLYAEVGIYFMDFKVEEYYKYQEKKKNRMVSILREDFVSTMWV